MASDQKRLFLALSLSALVLFTWQAYFSPKNTFSEEAQKQKISGSTKTTSNTSTASTSTVSQQATDQTFSGETQNISKQIILKNGENSIQISSSLVFSKIESVSAVDTLKEVVGGMRPIQFFVLQNGQKRLLNMDLVATDNTVIGEDKSLGVKFKGLLSEKGVLQWSFNSSNPFQYFIEVESVAKEGEARQIRQFLSHFKEVERVDIDDNEHFEGSLQWIGVDFHYHLFGTYFDNKQTASVDIKNKVLGAKIVDPTTSFTGATFVSMKNYDELQAMGKNLHLSVDYGVFGVIAVPILNGLQFIYKYIPNYGLAIIFITLFIRTLLFPLQFKSFKSMKKMQKLQPELAKVKEKYGEDPQRMQKETMELFKRNGANPMGGCLPLILQMPVFFAFYQVLFNSVELLNAPFFFWINDLSAKDPFYVLPVLMGVAMFAQTKLNPSTTVDPTQKKMMMFMPVIFTFFMKDLPAGLNLYMFVSTTYGIIQQLIVYKTIE